MATGINGARPVLRNRRHLYRLEFFADERGNGKIVELVSSDLKDALKLIKKDRSRRVVDAWQDGTRVCRVSHGPNGLVVRSEPPGECE